MINLFQSVATAGDEFGMAEPGFDPLVEFCPPGFTLLLLPCLDNSIALVGDTSLEKLSKSCQTVIIVDILSHHSRGW